MMRIDWEWTAVAAVVVMAFIAVGAGPARAEHAAATPEQKELEGAIHDYLLGHPETVLESLQILQQREEVAKADRQGAALATHREALLEDPTSPVAGNPNGDVTVVEFFDYQCPYCKRVLPHVKAVLEQDPGVRVVYKEYPILGPGSVLGAKAALASLKQDPDKYLSFHNALMSSRARLNETRIMQIAREIGFDVDRLRVDMAAVEIGAVIERNITLAQALGITGTPTFVIGDDLVPGAIDLNTLKQLIARARAS